MIMWRKQLIRYLPAILAFLGVCLSTVDHVIDNVLPGRYEITSLIIVSLVFVFNGLAVGWLIKKQVNLKDELQTIFNNVDATIWSVDLKRKSFKVSAGIEKMYGIPHREFTDNLSLWQNVTHPDDWPELAQAQAEVRRGKSVILERRIVKPDQQIVWVRDHLTPLSDQDGNLDKIIGIATDISQIKEHEMRLTQDLQRAAGIQNSLLPAEFPTGTGIKVAWQFKPCAYVGGDMFNIYPLDQRRSWFYICDVSGHGVAAALRAVTVSYFLKPGAPVDNGQAVQELRPGDVMAYLNQKFAGQLDGGFITLFLGVLDRENRQLTYARAGHCPPLLVSAAGAVQLLSKGQPPIGLFPEVEYQDYEVKLQAGDKLILYTDGVTEAFDRQREQFGEKRLEEMAAENSCLPIDQLTATIVRAVAAHADGAEQQDDLAILGIEVI